MASRETVLAASDRDEFRRIAGDELAGLYALARRLAGRDRAEDLVQEALVGASPGEANARSFEVFGRPGS